MFIPWTCAECDDSLPISGASSIPLCYILFPATLLHQLFLHAPSLHLTIHFLVYLLVFVNSKFIYNTLLGIIFFSILCTCPHQHNLCSLIVSVMVRFFNNCTNFFICCCFCVGLAGFPTTALQRTKAVCTTQF
jgi:hypothetical protein